MANIYNVISVTCLIMFFISLIITCILFYSLKINKIIADLSGYAGRRYVKKQKEKREENAKERIIDELAKASPINDEKKIDLFAEPKDIVIKHVAGGFYTGDTTKLSEDDDKTNINRTEKLEKTTVLSESELEKTTVLSESELEKTTVLSSSELERTTVLSNSELDRTTVLSEAELDRANFVEDITSVLSEESEYERNSDNYGETEVFYDARLEEVNITEKLIIKKELMVIHTDRELLSCI